MCLFDMANFLHFCASPVRRLPHRRTLEFSFRWQRNRCFQCVSMQIEALVVVFAYDSWPSQVCNRMQILRIFSWIYMYNAIRLVHDVRVGSCAGCTPKILIKMIDFLCFSYSLEKGWLQSIPLFRATSDTGNRSLPAGSCSDRAQNTVTNSLVIRDIPLGFEAKSSIFGIFVPSREE